MYQNRKETTLVPKFYMNEEKGVVQDIRGKRALVLTDREAMCGDCVARGCCHMLGGGKEMLSEAINTAGAEIGDLVKIGIPEGTLAKASLVIYMVPALGLVSGATLGYYVAQLKQLDINLSTLIGSIIGIGVALILVRLLSNALSKKPSYRPEIIEIISPHDPEGNNVSITDRTQ